MVHNGVLRCVEGQKLWFGPKLFSAQIIHYSKGLGVDLEFIHGLMLQGRGLCFEPFYPTELQLGVPSSRGPEPPGRDGMGWAGLAWLTARFCGVGVVACHTKLLTSVLTFGNL